MVVGGGFKLLGVKTAMISIKKSVKMAVNASEDGVKEATLYAEGQIKESIAHGKNAAKAVDTGRFLNSVTGTSKGKVGAVTSNVKYAPDLEFGTSKMSARPHFRNTMKKEQTKIQDFIKSKVSEVKR